MGLPEKQPHFFLGKMSINHGKRKGNRNEIDSNVIIGKSFFILGDKIW